MKFEIINEICLMFTTYTVFCFTQWGPNPEIKSLIGYIVVGLVSGHFLIGVSSMVLNTVSMTKARLKFYLIKKRYASSRVALKKDLQKRHKEIASRLTERRIVFDEIFMN